MKHLIETNHNNMKSFFYKNLFLTFFLFLFVVFVQSQEGTKNFIDQPYIEVNGKAEMEIIPDEIYLKIVISEKDNKYKLSIAELDKKLVSGLQAVGVDIEKDLSLMDLSSNFRNLLILKDEIVLSKEYELRLHSGPMVGKVARELEKSGISNISIIKTDHSKMEAFRKEVKAKAIKAAKSNAEVLSSTIGQQIGRALFIQEQYFNVMQSNIYMEKRAFGSMAVDESAEMPVDFEKIKLEFTVLVRFELK